MTSPPAGAAPATGLAENRGLPSLRHLESRHQADEEPRQECHSGAEQDRRSVQSDLVQEWNPNPFGTRHPLHGHPGQPTTHKGTHQRDPHAFQHQLPGDPALGGSQRLADGHLPGSLG